MGWALASGCSDGRCRGCLAQGYVYDCCGIVIVALRTHACYTKGRHASSHHSLERPLSPHSPSRQVLIVIQGTLLMHIKLRRGRHTGLPLY